LRFYSGEQLLGTPFTTRVILKIKRTVRELSRSERQFSEVWPCIGPIEGWLSDAETKWLFKRALSLPDAANLAEIGSYKGRSTVCLAFGCRNTNKRVFAIDTFDGGPDLARQDSFSEFRANVERCGLTKYVEPVKGISWEVARSWSTPLDFLFIDGSHIYSDVMADFASFFPHVARGGTVAFHDVHPNHPGVVKAWNETFKTQLTETGQCDSIRFGRKARQ
jgi:predicted O-methyltransferase YrrM